MNFDFFQNIDLLSVGIAVAAIGILGFVIFLNNRRSITSRTFLLFSAVTVFWSIVNYLQSSVLNPKLSFWLLRLVVFFAVWHAFSIFQLFYVFPSDKISFPKNYKKYLLLLVALTSIAALTPLVFESVAKIDFDGRLLKVNNGPAIALFTAVVVSLVLAALYLLIKKTIYAKAAEKKQFGWMLIGTFMTFVLLLIFNFLLPAFFNNPDYIPLGPVFLLPFAVFTFYAISSHNLLDVKIISTEVVAFFLIVAAFLQILLSKSAGQIFFQVFIFILLLIFSVFLIKSVVREVRQREKLEELTKELQAANIELKKLDRLKSDFLSFATHQLRSPLTLTKGYISMILDGSYGPLNSVAAEKLKKVYESNERLIKLVDDFLNLSRIEQGRMQYDFSRKSIEEIVEKAARELEETAKAKGLKLNWIRPLPPPSEMMIDAPKIYEVIYNLIDNAIKYTRSGKISVGIGKSGRFLKIWVRDTGIGLEPEEINELFKRFGRTKRARNYDVQGTGIGLYMAKYVIEAHGGRIWAESPGQNQGSVFYVELPIR
jgi:signal transduction histidine kinase